MKAEQLSTPCYLIDQQRLEHNLEILQGLILRSGCKILLAQKAFSMYALYPLIGKYLSGTAASGLYEARLGAEQMGKENHVFAPAYNDNEFDEIISLCDHIIFNSFTQLEKFKSRALSADVSIGLRINPEHSTQQVQLYDPCAPYSRLGITFNSFSPDRLDGVEGLHFHTLCEQNANALAETLAVVEKKFGSWLKQMKWINFGGGHHITRVDYDIALLESCIRRMQERYGLQVYLEPGEAVALNAGYLLTTVLETLHNSMDIAILDTSAACHMPDVLEMPYRPPLQNSAMPAEKQYTYRLAGSTCLAGDVIGDYSFDIPLRPGDRLLFEDMAIYTMVKNNTFNGMKLPSIAIKQPNGDCTVIREFDFEDFKMRLS